MRKIIALIGAVLFLMLTGLHIQYSENAYIIRGDLKSVEVVAQSENTNECNSIVDKNCYCINPGKSEFDHYECKGGDGSVENPRTKCPTSMTSGYINHPEKECWVCAD